MNRVFLAVICFVCMPSLYAISDMQIDLKLTAKEYVQYDRVMAFVTIKNESARPFVIDSKAPNQHSTITFIVRKNFKDKVEKRNVLPVVDFLEIPPRGKQELMFDLGMWYDLSNPNRYDVFVEIDRDGTTYFSQKILFDVVNGIVLATVVREVPGYEGRRRHYSLRYWAQNKKETLYLRVEEPDNGIIYGVFPLGDLVRVYKPILEVDFDGNVVIKHQSARNRLTRTVFKSEAHSVVFVDQKFFTEDGRPFTKADAEQVTPPPTLPPRTKR